MSKFPVRALRPALSRGGDSLWRRSDDTNTFNATFIIWYKRRNVNLGFGRFFRFFPIASPPHLWYDIAMKHFSVPTTKELAILLDPCVSVLPEGFRIDLSQSPRAWNDALRRYGGRALCSAAAAQLCDAYRQTFHKPFLFSEPCISHELRYHLLAYLWTQKLCVYRPLSTLLLPRARLERACRSVEIDIGDVYRWSQRIIFRYFFGIRKELRKTDQDPYAARIGKRLIRIPFLKK